MSIKLQLRRGLETNLPTLAVGEQGFCTDSYRLFIGSAGGNKGVAMLDSPIFTGNIGIGTIAPAQKLDIEKGHIRLGQVACPGAPTVAINPAVGNLNGGYYYRITFVTALGETETGAVSALVSPINQQVDLSNIPVSADPAVISRRIYRTIAGDPYIFHKFVDTVAGNITTIYTDNIADGALGVMEPRINRTGGIFYNGANIVGINDKGTTAWGEYALQVNNGWGDSAFGRYALYQNSSGYDNNAFGLYALASNTIGFGNSSFGSYSLRFSVNGYCNCAFGIQSLWANVDGVDNTAIGAYSLLTNTIGLRNCAMGYLAMQYNTQGSYNVCIGARCGQNPLNDIAQYRSIADEYITLLGYGATKDNAAAITNSMALGAFAHVTKSNQVVIGDANVTEINLNLTALPTAANNAAAQGAGIDVGGLYRTNADPSVVCIRSA